MKRCLLKVCLAGLLFQTLQAYDPRNSNDSLENDAFKEAINCVGDLFRIGALIGSLYIVSKHERKKLAQLQNQTYTQETTTSRTDHHHTNDASNTKNQEKKLLKIMIKYIGLDHFHKRHNKF